jgi:hypothetical protein
MKWKYWSLLGIFSGFGLGIAQADEYTQLIQLLKAKCLLTEQEAQKLIAKHEANKEKERIDKDLIKTIKNLKGIKIGGVAYLHYDYTVHDTDKTKDDYNAFKITRAYVEIRKYFDKANYFRITGDIYQDKDKGDTDDGYKFRLKYAYLNWKFNNLLEAEIGLAHRPWIDWEEHHGWLHRYMEKTFIEDSDGAHLINSADLGIALKGKRNTFSYMVGIYNGEGYHTAEQDRHFGKSLEGRVTYGVPEYGLTFSLHAAYIDHDTSGNDDTDLTIVQPWIGYKNDYFLVAAQYIYDNENNESGPDYNNNGFSANFDLYLKKLAGMPLTIFGRYGNWNYDDDAEKNGKIDRTQYLIGAEYTFNKHIKAGLSYKYVDYDKKVKDRDYKDKIMAAMQVKW